MTIEDITGHIHLLMFHDEMVFFPSLFGTLNVKGHIPAVATVRR
jgi:hypothetical protein